MGYNSPEILMQLVGRDGSKVKVGTPTDIFSLGIVLLDLLMT